MKTKLTQGFTLIELLVVITIISILAGLAVPAFNRVQEQAQILQAVNNAHQVILTLKGYAADNGGAYPDADKQEPPQTSNDAFRLLFKRGLIRDERIFVTSCSPFVTDGNVGEAPGFDEAVKAGENHWSMTKGLSDTSNSDTPLIFENPVNGGSWPPAWNCNTAGQRKQGRAWVSGRIVVGRNDGSVTAEPLEALTGDQVGLRKNSSGKDLFSQLGSEAEFLDVARE